MDYKTLREVIERQPELLNTTLSPKEINDLENELASGITKYETEYIDEELQPQELRKVLLMYTLRRLLRTYRELEADNISKMV